MKYSFIEIRANPKFSDERFGFRYDNSDNSDREPKKKYEPHPLGFFYYPKRWEPSKAFNILKDNIITNLKKEVDKIQKDIQEIEKLELPDWVKK